MLEAYLETGGGHTEQVDRIQNLVVQGAIKANARDATLLLQSPGILLHSVGDSQQCVCRKVAAPVPASTNWVRRCGNGRASCYGQKETLLTCNA
jgi:hypothetical protein